MSITKTNNLLLEVPSLCMTASRRYVEPYSHRNSPQRFTQAQLLVHPVLKAYLKTTYRGVIEFVEVSDELKQRIGLASFPHYRTLQKFADRTCVQDIVDGILPELAQQFAAGEKDVAIDSTRFETTCASAHFRTKSGRNRTKYINVSVCVLATSLLPSSVVPGWGSNNDKLDAPDLPVKSSKVNHPDRLYNDAQRKP